MKVVIQRVSSAKLSVEGELISEIGRGLVVYFGVSLCDYAESAAILAAKISKLRIFEDDAGKMNLSLLDVGGSAIVVSQFTLCASYRKGNRPDYLAAAAPELAVPLYEAFVRRMQEQVADVSTGRVGADMQVAIVNDGPVTIQLDSRVLKQPKRGA